MYVQWEEPAEVTRPHPIVLVHGGGGQGTDYLGTPDGRPGWATDLVELGFAVYTVDRPGHGRAPLHPDALGAMGPSPTREFVEWLFTPPFEGEGSHPTAHLHTQWPGTREPDDPVVDQFWAGTGPMLADFAVAHALEGARLAELLDRIGPAILVTHSAGGPGGWVAADARPDRVVAMVAIETMGPPFAHNPALGFTLTWGLAAAPLTFDPPAATPSELELVTRELGDGRPPMTLQAEPARRLPSLASFPIAVVSAEASVFVHIDDHTVEFLRQAGCDVERVRLAEHGVHGNGHGMMLERNSTEALGVIVDWLDRRVPAPR
jgi:pimeloyl-ACP methyl ester carboxylesterase